jgi:hypothetical protein
VPVGFSTVGAGAAEDTEPALSASVVGCRKIPFCFSRACRRSWLRLRRSSSFATLPIVSMVMDSRKWVTYRIASALSQSGLPVGLASYTLIGGVSEALFLIH